MTIENPIDLRADYHGHATDFACTQDRAYFRANPDSRVYRRPAVEHEMCPPGEPCLDMSGALVEVTQITPGVRARWPLFPRLKSMGGAAA